MQGADAVGTTDLARPRAVVDAFLAASRGGDLGALVALLDPRIVARADAAAVAMGADAEWWAPTRWPPRSEVGPRPPSSPWWTNAPAWCGPWAVNPRWCSTSPSKGDLVVAIELISDADAIAELDLEPDLDGLEG
jgi:RNA polymerase sigma-70 factor (ECF subfamily)